MEKTPFSAPGLGETLTSIWAVRALHSPGDWIKGENGAKARPGVRSKQELILQLSPEQPERRQASSSGLDMGGCDSEAARETDREHLLGNEATQTKTDTRDRGSYKAGIIIGLP